MKINVHALHSCQFEAEEKKRKVHDLDEMIADFRQMVINLDQQIISEQEKSGISDINHFAYPTFAKAAIQRRDNLIISVEELETKLGLAKQEMDDATEELTKAEQLERRENGDDKLQRDIYRTSSRF